MATVLIMTTFPEVAQARTAIETLVSEGLAACGTMIKDAESIYAWKGKVETAQETMVMLKAPAASFPAIQQRLLLLHTYEVPEVIAVDITHGLPAYLGWVQEACAEAQAAFHPRKPREIAD